MKRLAVLIASLATLIGFAAPAHSNHLINWDCAVWDESRGPYTGTSLEVRWSVSDRYQKIVSLRIGNSGTQTADIRIEYHRWVPDNALYKSETFHRPPNTSLFVSGWDNTQHNQTYHAGIKVYRNGTYLFSVNPWISGYTGNMDYVTNLTNCNPTLDP